MAQRQLKELPKIPLSTTESILAALEAEPRNERDDPITRLSDIDVQRV
jgi:hypothetical protein